MEVLRLAFKRFFVFVAAITVFGLFSLSYNAAKDVLLVFLLVGIGDAEGMKLVILRSGNLIFEGPNGGFCSPCLRDASGLVEAAAKALVSCCFSLVFRCC